MTEQGIVKKQRLAALLRSIRLEAGMTQVQVSLAIGEPQSYVSKYESGEQRLDLIEIEEVCVAVGLDLRTLVERYLES